MNTADRGATVTWAQGNADHLRAEIARISALLVGSAPISRTRQPDEGVPALVALERLFGLSSFEYDLVVLCLGAALEPSIATLLGGWPTFATAVARLPRGDLQAASPTAPLRAHHIVMVGGGDSVWTARLSLEERILHFLVGVPAIDERLVPLLNKRRGRGPLAPSHHALTARIVGLLREHQFAPIVQLFGCDTGTRAALAAEVAAATGRAPLYLRARALPVMPAELESIARTCDREQLLTNVLPIVEIDGHDPPEATRAARELVELSHREMVLLSDEAVGSSRADVIQLELPDITTEDRRAIWRALLGEHAIRLGPTIDQLSSQFRNSHADISSVVSACDFTAQSDELGDRMWTSCLERSRPRLDEQARRITPRASWEDLVIPAPLAATLREVLDHLHYRHDVHDRWGFDRENVRGNAITALFAGPSGTGKTMAAEVLAREAKLDLYHVDLSQVVDKYVGETEKRLRRIFDAAEQGGAILLFDEADALFGKRATVERASDRWANVEVSYLLQRMESYHGLAILTTNAKDSLDRAFLRRIRFVATFPFPDVPHRHELWKRAFPVDAPTSGVDLVQLARLQLSGANIKSAALKAAFHAASEGSPITQSHVVRATRSEYAKLELLFPEDLFSNAADCP